MIIYRKSYDKFGVKTVSGRIMYDVFGRAIANYYPTVQSLGDTTYYTGVDTVNPSMTHYDLLDRPLRQEAPDGTFQTFAYGFGQDGAGHILFKTTAVDQRGHPSLVLKDVNGLQWAIKPAGEPYVYFAYDKMGQCDSVYSSLPDDFSRKYTYDMLGRKTSYAEGYLSENYTYTGTNLTEKQMHWYNSIDGIMDNKILSYTYQHNRLLSIQSSEYNLPTEYVYDDPNQHGRLVAIKDESGIQTFEYGTMGEITKTTRAYALPTQAQPIALSTEFTYDSWGRMKNITYPDGEILTYAYDRGGQLKAMNGVKQGQPYVYLIDMLYDKFGAKTEMAYGNSMVTKYMYDPVNLRLDSLVACLQANKYFSMGYRYDAKGNVNTLYSSYTCFYNDSTIKQTFVYDSTDQIKEAMGNVVNGSSMYTVSVNYNNWGKVGGYTTSMNGTDTFMYPSTNPISTHFAPNTSVNNGQTTTYDFGINGSLRRKQNDDGAEYYLFNAFNCMKAYSYNGERFGYYGYDASGERMYKMDINYIGVFTNEYEQISENWELGKMMLYPNGYMNINQNGEYTKHYYADALRIASKIGSGFSGNICDSAQAVDNAFPGYLGDRMSEQYSAMINEMYEAAVLPSPTGYLTFVNPYPDFCNIGFGGQETGLFFYHVDHLGSTGMVTDINANIQQGFLYAPFGEILFEQNLSWESDRIPKYSFNAKELDEENGMYYYSARYYAPPTFISRDPKFEQYFWLSPYCAFANNPLKYSDPTGMDFDEAQDKKYIQPMEKDIQNKIDGLKKQMSGLKEGSDEYNRLNDHVTELGNALTEISALRNDKDNLYLINFNGLGFNKEAGGDDSYHDAAGSLTYGGTNANGQNVININIKGQYIGTSGIMLHEFKHADQYRTGDLGFYVNSTGRQVSTSNSQELERAANYRGDVFSYPSTSAKSSYTLQGYGDLEKYTANVGQYRSYAKKNGWIYISNNK